MSIRERGQMFLKRLLGRHGDVKSFDDELRALGGPAASRHVGIQAVPTAKVVGSVGRWRNLRSDFFYKQGRAMTERFVRIGSAMRQGKSLPPLELYKMKVRRPRGKQNEPVEVTEYYVVDGHHRVAMARKLGQDFLDARIVEYQVGASAGNSLPPSEQTADFTATQGPEVEQPHGQEPGSAEQTEAAKHTGEGRPTSE